MKVVHALRPRAPAKRDRRVDVGVAPPRPRVRAEYVVRPWARRMQQMPPERRASPRHVDPEELSALGPGRDPEVEAGAPCGWDKEEEGRAGGAGARPSAPTARRLLWHPWCCVLVFASRCA